MYKDLFEKTRLVEFGYEAQYREVIKLEANGARELAELMEPLGWPPEEVSYQIQAAIKKGVYLLHHEGKVAELRDLPARVDIEMLSYDDDEQSLIGDRVEARFDPNDPHETLYISGETFDRDSKL